MKSLQNFGLQSLFALVFAIAVLIAIGRYSWLWSLLLFPTAIGPIVARSFFQTGSAVFAGMLTAMFWTYLGYGLLAGLTSSPLQRFFTAESVPDQIAMPFLVLACLTSLGGGYLGAKVADH